MNDSHCASDPVTVLYGTCNVENHNDIDWWFVALFEPTRRLPSLVPTYK